MRFALLYTAYLLLPGLWLTEVLRLRPRRWFVVVACSYAVLATMLVSAKALGLPPRSLLAGWHGALALMALYLLYRWADAGRGLRLRPRPVWAIAAGGLVLLSAYLLLAGPYLEVPADAWYHLGRIQAQLRHLASDRLPALVSGGRPFSKWNEIGYLIPALPAFAAGAPVARILHPLAFVHTLVFLAGVYSFALYLYRRPGLTGVQRHGIATLSAFFFLVQFGIGPFSYLRYYTFAPALLNHLLYLAAAALYLEALRTRRPSPGRLGVIAGLVAAAAAVHLQEALFALVMMALLTVLHGLRRWRAGRHLPARLCLFGAAFLATYLSLHAYALVALSRHPPLAHDRLIPVADLLPFLKRLYILDPAGEFYRVVGLWGLLVYGLFCFRRCPPVRGHLFLAAGMLSPLVTVFNPAFVDLFLHFNQPWLIWRLCFLIPLPFVAAGVLVNGPARRRPSFQWTTGRLAVILLLGGLLLPVHSDYLVNRESRMHSLLPVAPANSHALWSDLYATLRRLPPSQVLTDPVTGYTLNALTGHRHPGYKFYPHRLTDLTRDRYQEADFRPFDGGLLVINRRDGAPSAAGRISGHWPAHVLQVSRYYSEALQRFVASRPDRFRPLWARDRIALYRITLAAPH